MFNIIICIGLAIAVLAILFILIAWWVFNTTEKVRGIENRVRELEVVGELERLK